MNSCYLCGKTPANNPLELSKTFTAHSSARSPLSDKLCDRCYPSIAGDEKQLAYFNPNKNAWAKIWGRSLSRLYQGDKLLSPIIEGEREGLQIVKDLATREQIRGWLLDPPEPPFMIAIAQSGQKHITPLAQEGFDRDRFPVQFETESIWVVRAEFTVLLEKYQALMNMGFSKTEITSGHYRSDRIVALTDITVFYDCERAIEPHRGTSLIQLIDHVA